jgi:L-lactate dehydrogenase
MRPIVPQVMRVPPGAVLLVVTDPLDPLADLGRKIAKHDRVLSTGTFLDSTIIEGNNASQYGIGMVSARIAQAVLRDERLAIPVDSFHAQYGVTFSLPSVVGRDGVVEVLEPDLSDEERSALERIVG